MFGIRNGVINHGGRAADLQPEGKDRGFFGRFSMRSWASVFYLAGWHTASISSFPFRHGASWWNSGFMESMNLIRGFGGESKKGFRVAVSIRFLTVLFARDISPCGLVWFQGLYFRSM